MYKYNITYSITGPARSFKCEAESHGEAVELFEEFAERFPDGADILSVKEVGE